MTADRPRASTTLLGGADRVTRRLRRLLAAARNRTRSRWLSSYTEPGNPAAALHRIVGCLDKDFSEGLAADFAGHGAVIAAQASDAMAHRFDLLGSGPVHVAHGVACKGVEGNSYRMSVPVRADAEGRWLEGRINAANLRRAQGIWRLVDPGYEPIDWQLDFKSGYRWREDLWHGDIRYGDVPGADVKVPWELARCQHLGILGLACHFARGDRAGFAAPERYVREIRNQVLDFAATNPPGFGVNWACAMDVAIRATNMVIARDIALAAGARFDKAFEDVFAGYLLAHGLHVAANLEWAPQYRGNHYLANIAGMLFIAASLPASAQVDAWLAFAGQELLEEVAYQFHEDGSNFEASVCYHRLSAEMVLWASALLEGLPSAKKEVLQRPQNHPSLPRLRVRPAMLQGVPSWALLRLGRMADFTRAMTRPDGLVVQFGDNDSGRFVPLGGGEQARCANDPSTAGWSLDHASLVVGIDTLLGRPPCENGDPAARVLRALAGDRPAGQLAIEMPAVGEACRLVGSASDFASFSARHAQVPAECRWTTVFDAAAAGAVSLLEGLQCLRFPGMGCHVFRSARLYLAVRCGENGIAGLGAHAHCDQLGIELVIDGHSIVRDPGTYLYTASPARRNAYRSASAHHVPRVEGREPANLGLGLFDLRGAPEGECLYFGPLGFVGRHGGYGNWVYRQILLGEHSVVVQDFSEGDLHLSDPTPASLPFSPGYGRLETAEAAASP